MFFRQVGSDIKLGLSVPQFADGMFELTDRNREFLREWLPWLDSVTRAADVRAYIEAQLQRFQSGEALHVTIFYQDRMAGAAGFNHMDRTNGVGHIGYWLAREFNGRGIMTASVRDLIAVGYEFYDLNRIEIRCAVDNFKSRAIPERLGFKQEGIIRRAESLYGRHVDHVIYGLLHKETVTS